MDHSNPSPGYPSLPLDPPEHAAMDYARLRQEGIRLLERLAGRQWTDFNVHDPGITILEQVCYAITELGYRTAHPVQDLLAGPDGDAGTGLPGPATILTSHPVTRTDLRQLVVDVPGVGNAWIEDPRPELECFFHEPSGELRFHADPGEAESQRLHLRGLHHVLLHTAGPSAAGATVHQVARRVHAHRNLCEDFVLDALGAQDVYIRAHVEVDAADDPTAILARIYERLEAWMAPLRRFVTYDQARRDGRASDELFVGPALEHGFIPDLGPERRTQLHASDLIRTLMDVASVRTVRALTMATTKDGEQAQWTLDLSAGSIPHLARDSEIVLLRSGLPVRVDRRRAWRMMEDSRTAALAASPPADGRDLAAPRGRDRDVGHYRSIQHQFPAIYGVGRLGLPASTSPRRRAQARQLRTYLLFFDQLLANAFAQLAHARELLSWQTEPTRTYFAQPIDDPSLGLNELRDDDDAAHAAWLAHTVDARRDGAADPLALRSRLLEHLLARYAEQFTEHTLVAHPASVVDRPFYARLAFLRQYPRLSSARAVACDAVFGDDARSTLEQRVALRLGIDDGSFFLVEHVLLRPVAEDARQLAEEGEPQVPLLAGVRERDPYSLQLSLVFAEQGDPQFAAFVEQTLVTEVPAHVTAHLHWLSDAERPDWSSFVAALAAFRTAHRHYREAALRRGRIPDESHLRLRDARDRLVDMLELGQTFPLRDLPVPRRLAVVPGTAPRIPVEFSQSGVIYSLRDGKTGAPIVVDGLPVRVGGDGGTIELVGGPIDHDVVYRILADKSGREAWLHQAVTVEVGVDPTLEARIRRPLLDPHGDEASSTAPRIAEHHAEVEVEVLRSQEGVTYELVDHRDPDRLLSQSAVVGTSGTIVVHTVALDDDVDLRVRGTKLVGTPDNPLSRTALLDAVLPLKVRPDPGRSAALVPGPVVAFGAGALALDAQEGVEYQLFARRIRDRDYVFDDPAPGDTLAVALAGGHQVRVARPGEQSLHALDGFAPVGQALAGVNGALQLALSALHDDSLLRVRATRWHCNGPLGSGSALLPSTSLLDPLLVALVRPDHQRAIRLRAGVSGGAIAGPLVVLAGQPGVYYRIEREDDGAAIDRLAYFHQRDDVDAGVNKGLEQIRIEVDLAVPRHPSDDAPFDPTTDPPPPPALDSQPWPLGTLLRVRAVKAMTTVDATLDLRATLHPVPDIHPDPAQIAAGQSTTILIADSRPDERYQLLRDGQPIGEPHAGDGGVLGLDTGALAPGCELAVAITRDEPAAIVVERLVTVAVAVEEQGVHHYEP